MGEVGCDVISVGPNGAMDAKRSTSRTGLTKPSINSTFGTALARGCMTCLGVVEDEAACRLSDPRMLDRWRLGVVWTALTNDCKESVVAGSTGC